MPNNTRQTLGHRSFRSPVGSGSQFPHKKAPRQVGADALTPKKSHEQSKSLPKNPNKNQHTKNTINPPQQLGFVSGYSSQTKDLEVEAVEFLDLQPTAEKPILNYIVRDKQSFFAPGTVGGAGENVARIKSVEVYALPRASNASIATTSYAILYETPAVAGFDTPEGPAFIITEARQTAQRNTIVNPTFNVKWVLVGRTNFDKVFKASQITPVRYEQNAETSGIIAFAMTAINPDNKAIITEPIQLMVKVRYNITMPVETLIQVASGYTKSFSVIPTEGFNFGGEYCMNKLIRVADIV